MTNFLHTTLVAGALAAAALGLAGAAGAESDNPTPVATTISKLAAKGYRVIVDRVGSAPIDQCTVSMVRPGQTYSRTDHGVPGGDLATTVSAKTVYVDVTC